MARTEGSPEKVRTAPVLCLVSQTEGKIMSKHNNNGYTATEVQSEGVILQVAESKPELPVYQEMTGLLTAVGQMTPILEGFPLKVHNVATASQSAQESIAELKKLEDMPAGKLLLALAQDKIGNLEAQLTDSAKKDVNVSVASLRQIMSNIKERVDAIEAKYGSKPVATRIAQHKGGTPSEGNITDTNKGNLEELLNSRGYSDISFDLMPNGKNYRVSAFNPSGKARATLFTSNVERDWI